MGLIYGNFCIDLCIIVVCHHLIEDNVKTFAVWIKKFCPQDALDAMKALGLNPGEQEMIDMTNEVNINGLIYFPDFCKLVLRKYREENREVLNQALFKVICGTDPYPKNFRAKKYKIKDKFFTKKDFQFMMRNLPVPVPEEDIDQMFDFADKDRDGKINYRWEKELKWLQYSLFIPSASLKQWSTPKCIDRHQNILSETWRSICRR